MPRRLGTFVHVAGQWYGPDDQVPAEVAEQIGDHAWAVDADQDDDGETAVGYTDPGAGGGQPVEAPPRTGRGSGIEAWRAFAEQHDVEVDADASRDDVIAAVEAAGVIEREE